MRERVFIGLLSYNRPTGLAASLACLTAQTHHDIEILVSDNASPDPGVQAVILEYTARDSRVRYHRHASNIGAAGNFKFLLDAADAIATPYFMWASDDDLWEADFVASNLALLAAHPVCQMAFGSIDNINSCGAKIRDYAGFSRFTSGASRRDDAARFIMEPEILGKGNLFYGLFRTQTLQQVNADIWDIAWRTPWGVDMVLMFAFVSRFPIVTQDRVLLHKSMPVASDALIEIRDPRTYFVPSKQFRSYVARHKAVAPDADIAAMAGRLLWQRRWQQARAQLSGLLRRR